MLGWKIVNNCIEEGENNRRSIQDTKPWAVEEKTGVTTGSTTAYFI